MPDKRNLLAQILARIGQISAAPIPKMSFGTQVPANIGTTLPEQLGATTRGTLADIGTLTAAPLQPALAGIRGLQNVPAQFQAGFQGVPFQPPIITPPVTTPPFNPDEAILPPQTTTPLPQPTQQGIGKRELLALALQVGLPLALASFGGERGLAAGAGLATGFGEAGKLRQEFAEKKAEREQREKLEQQQINIQKDLAELQKEREKRELAETAIVATPKGFLGRQPSVEQIKKTQQLLQSLISGVTPATAGIEQAGKVQEAIKRTIPKGKIIVQDKQGNQFYLPKGQLKQATTQGFTQVE